MFKKKFIVLFIGFIFIFNVDCFAKKQQQQSSINVLEEINYNWWLGFNDINLSKYIVELMTNNFDLKIANLKIKEYNEYLKYSFGAELPTLSVGYMDASLYGKGSKQMKQALGGTVKNITHPRSLPLTLDYEIDLFGKNRNATQSVKKQLQAFGEDVRALNINMVSAMSGLYFNIIKVNKMIDFVNELIYIRTLILNDTVAKYNSNIVADVDVNRVKNELNETTVYLENLKQTQMSLKTQFALLLGRNPTEIDALSVSNLDSIEFRNAFFENLVITSNTIFNRPDVRSVELQMEKADIDIKVARKEFLPTLSISGTLSFSNLGAGGFFSSANTAQSLLFSVGQTLFTGGRKKANVNMKKYKYQQMVEQYKQVSLQAIKEVNDAVYIAKSDQRIYNTMVENLTMARRNFEKYETMYKNGLVSFGDLKKAEQLLISAKMDEVDAKVQNYIDVINLYKVCGGKIDNINDDINKK